MFFGKSKDKLNETKEANGFYKKVDEAKDSNDPHLNELNKPENLSRICNFVIKYPLRPSYCGLAHIDNLNGLQCRGSDFEKKHCLLWKILFQLQEMSGTPKDLTVHSIENLSEKMKDKINEEE